MMLPIYVRLYMCIYVFLLSLLMFMSVNVHICTYFCNMYMHVGIYECSCNDIRTVVCMYAVASDMRR